MRVTNASTYRNYTSGVNNVHLSLNKSFNKISSGKAYEAAKDSPLSYYEGKRIDNQFLDTQSKLTLLQDVRNRVYQQEVGVRNIHTILSGDQGAKNRIRYARTATTTGAALESAKLDLLQKQHEIVDSLNMQYQDYYIYGGNDHSTRPFTLSEDGKTLTYTHKFPGDATASTVTMELKEKTTGDGYEFQITGASSPSLGNDGEKILAAAMKEQGRVDVGYGSIFERGTLLDTYTGGLNVLTGVTSDAIKEWTGNGGTTDANGKGIMDYLNKSALTLVGQAVQAIDKYQTDEAAGNGDRDAMSKILGDTIETMTETEQTLSTAYSDLGNKYHLMDNTEERLNSISDSLKVQYQDIMGADPYASIMEMFSNQYAYNASLQIGSKLMGSSLFDFMS